MEPAGYYTFPETGLAEPSDPRSFSQGEKEEVGSVNLHHWELGVDHRIQWLVNLFRKAAQGSNECLKHTRPVVVVDAPNSSRGEPELARQSEQYTPIDLSGGAKFPLGVQERRP